VPQPHVVTATPALQHSSWRLLSLSVVSGRCSSFAGITLAALPHLRIETDTYLRHTTAATYQDAIGIMAAPSHIFAATAERTSLQHCQRRRRAFVLEIWPGASLEIWPAASLAGFGRLLGRGLTASGDCARLLVAWSVALWEPWSSRYRLYSHQGTRSPAHVTAVCLCVDCRPCLRAATMLGVLPSLQSSF
jgi:hypothetical protein